MENNEYINYGVPINPPSESTGNFYWRDGKAIWKYCKDGKLILVTGDNID